MGNYVRMMQRQVVWKSKAVRVGVLGVWSLVVLYRQNGCRADTQEGPSKLRLMSLLPKRQWGP